MADAVVELQLVPELGLPYEVGAETALAPDDLAAFVAASELLGLALTLTPSYGLPVEALGDIMAAARQGGSEPPDLFSFFSVIVPEELAADAEAALDVLPFVLRAIVATPAVVCGWSVAADPATFQQFHLRRAPIGVDAYLTWTLPSGGGRDVRVVDVEHAADLTHPDLIGVRALGPFSRLNAGIDHGTSCIGLVAGASNGAETTGIVPQANMAFSPLAIGIAEAIHLGAADVGRGGVLLIEVGTPRVGAPTVGAAPLEHSVAVWGAIRAATDLGVLVIEPAGNGTVDLDADPLFGHISRPQEDSGALMVAAAENLTAHPAWTISTFSSRGTRIDCFCPGEEILAPSNDPANLTRTVRIRGTSPASAIMAGVAAAVQGLARANGSPLTAAELRARLRDRANGTEATPPTTPIGVMPDLAKLAAGLGFVRLPPLTSVAVGGGRVAIVRAQPAAPDDLDVLLTNGTAAGATRAPVTTTPPTTRANGHECALARSTHLGVDLIDSVTCSEEGFVLHRTLDLDAGLAGGPWRSLMQRRDDRFLVSAPLSMTLASGRVVVLGLEDRGSARGFVAVRAAGSHELVPTAAPAAVPSGNEPEVELVDPDIHFDATPALVNDAGARVATLVGVDRAGRLRHGTWSLPRRWTSLEQLDAGLDTRHPPAVVVDRDDVHMLAVDATTRELRTTVRTARGDGSFSFSAPRVIATASLATFGIAQEPAGGLTAAGDQAGMLMTLALDALGRPLFTVRLPGLDWAPLLFVPASTVFAARGGLALTSPSRGVFVAAAVDASGALHTARWEQVAWLPFVPA